MPIFSKPKSASLNPDKLPNKKVYERDKKRVKSGTPSASSKVDADTFTSLTQALEELKNDLIRLEDATATFGVESGKLDYGNFLNIVSKAKKLLLKVQSSSITTSQQIELQEYADQIGGLYNNIDTIQNENTLELQSIRELGQGRILGDAEKNLGRVVSFFKNILNPLRQFVILLNSKLVISGNDANRNVPPEISGINAPPPVVEGAGFKTSYRLEKGAIQYQNQKYI
jgi:hypothetical protein